MDSPIPPTSPAPASIPPPSPPPYPLRRRRRCRQGKARAARRLFSSNGRVVRGSGGSILDADGGKGRRTTAGSSPPGGGRLEAAMPVPILWGLARRQPSSRPTVFVEQVPALAPHHEDARGRQPWAWRWWSPSSPEVVGQ
jgi:hypothetical protein